MIKLFICLGLWVAILCVCFNSTQNVQGNDTEYYNQYIIDHNTEE